MILSISTKAKEVLLYSSSSSMVSKTFKGESCFLLIISFIVEFRSFQPLHRSGEVCTWFIRVLQVLSSHYCVVSCSSVTELQRSTAMTVQSIHDTDNHSISSIILPSKCFHMYNTCTSNGWFQQDWLHTLLKSLYFIWFRNED